MAILTDIQPKYNIAKIRIFLYSILLERNSTSAKIINKPSGENLNECEIKFYLMNLHFNHVTKIDNHYYIYFFEN